MIILKRIVKKSNLESFKPKFIMEINRIVWMKF